MQDPLRQTFPDPQVAPSAKVLDAVQPVGTPPASQVVV
jgi:hypothetical protein